jgi:hypothetical protein
VDTVIVMNYDNSVVRIIHCKDGNKTNQTMWDWVNKFDSRGTPMYKVYLAERIPFDCPVNPYHLRKEKQSCPMY